MKRVKIEVGWNHLRSVRITSCHEYINGWRTIQIFWCFDFFFFFFLTVDCVSNVIMNEDNHRKLAQRDALTKTYLLLFIFFCGTTKLLPRFTVGSVLETENSQCYRLWGGWMPLQRRRTRRRRKRNQNGDVDTGGGGGGGRVGCQNRRIDAPPRRHHHTLTHTRLFGCYTSITRIACLKPPNASKNLVYQTME